MLETFTVDVQLQCGVTLKNAKLVYKTYGTLNATKTNVVVIPTYYTGRHYSNEPYFGAGKPIDPEHHFIIIPNMFGNGISSSPSNTPPPFDGPNFPNISIYDNVICQHKLLVEKWGIQSILLVCGWSMGALQTYQWACLFPDMVQNIVPFCGAARCPPVNYVFLEGLKAILAANIGENGLKAFGKVYCGWAYSPDWFREELYKEVGLASMEELFKWWEEDHLAWNPYDLLTMLWTWQHADLSANDTFKGDFKKALRSIKARAIVMPATTDKYFPVIDNELEVKEMTNAELRPIPSKWGHMAGSPRAPQLDANFLQAGFASALGPKIQIPPLPPLSHPRERVVVTGAAGGIGRRVVKLLLEYGNYEVIGTDKVAYPDSPSHFVVADLCNSEQVHNLLQNANCVIHTAAIPGPTLSTPAGCPQEMAKKAQIVLETLDPKEVFDNNIQSTFNVFDQATKLGLRRVVFSSSAFAMGWSHDPTAFVPQYFPIDENHLMGPFETYGLSKQVGEDIAQMMAKSSSTSFISLRFTNVIHPEKVDLLPWPAPTQISPATLVMWAYTDVQDASLAHLLALQASLTGHEAFLIAAPNTRFREPTVDLIKLHFGDKVPIRIPLEGNASIISCEKAKRLLGFYPKSLF